jgi:ribose transport system permease protein
MTDTALAPSAPAKPSTAVRLLKEGLSRYSLVLVWILMAVIFSMMLPGVFGTGDVAKAIFGSQTPLVFLGLALVITLSVGEFDLSFAAIFGWSATLVPALVVLYGWSMPMAVLAALVSGLAWGAINAILVVLVGINSVIVTLGVSSVAGGAAYYVSQSTTVSGIDPELSTIALGEFLGLPYIFWYGVIIVAIAAYVMSATPLGRAMVFVGSNREVARLAGIDVTLFRFLAYLVSALLCTVAGIIVTIGLGGYDPAVSATYFLPTFACVFLGTVAVVPGRFNPIGMFIAVYFLITGVIGFQLLGYSGWVTDVFYGLALIVAVTISFFVQKRLRV